MEGWVEPTIEVHQPMLGFLILAYSLIDVECQVTVLLFTLRASSSEPSLGVGHESKYTLLIGLEGFKLS